MRTVKQDNQKPTPNQTVNSAKIEMQIDELEDAVGGAQVENRNEVINNNGNVKIDPTVVINM